MLLSLLTGSGKADVGLAPWVGYQSEEELKSKILELSKDKRNFIRAPPSGVSFDFDYSSVSSSALALLQEDEKLKSMRYVAHTNLPQYEGPK
jgi:hypothetical protein